MAAPRILIDACVLYPTVCREVVLAAAATGAFAPLWSGRIVEEWQHAAARPGSVQATVAAGKAAVLRARWPGAEVAAEAVARAERDFDCSLPDPGDAHVLAAALAGGATGIATFNLRDFPARALARHGLRAVHPDALMMEMWAAAPAPVADAVRAVQAEAVRLSGADQPLRPLLKRARLPRLGKALAG